MKKKINEFHLKVGHEIQQRLKRLCGRPSPKKRLVVVLLVCVIFATVNIWFLVSAICGIGKNDAEMELIKLQHIETLELQKRNKEVKDFKELKESKENDEK